MLGEGEAGGLQAGRAGRQGGHRACPEPRGRSSGPQFKLQGKLRARGSDPWPAPPASTWWHPQCSVSITYRCSPLALGHAQLLQHLSPYDCPGNPAPCFLFIQTSTRPPAPHPPTHTAYGLGEPQSWHGLQRPAKALTAQKEKLPQVLSSPLGGALLKASLGTALACCPARLSDVEPSAACAQPSADTGSALSMGPHKSSCHGLLLL